MELNDNASKTKSLSANQLAELSETRLSYKESLTCGSKPKIQLLELVENIQAAETNYDSVKSHWDYVKSLRGDQIYDGSQRSLSSYSSLKITISEHSIQKEEPDHDDDQVEGLLGKARPEKRIEVVLTPRSQKNDNEPIAVHEEIVPNLEIRNDSLESVKTRKRTKKTLKSKKKAHPKLNNDALKVSMISTNVKVKRKKLHSRLKNANSKSTIATRDTNFSDKKTERKKFKMQKSLVAISTQPTQGRKRGNTLKASESQTMNEKEFVEIYHHAALKRGSLSVVSSRHSKPEPSQVPQIPEEAIQAVGDSRSRRDIIVIEPTTEMGAEHPRSPDKNNNLSKSDDQYQQNDEQVNVNYSPEVYDSFYQRNYEMPTMASKMKRVHRSYYRHFQIRNIPFVVGTSLSPSHNLGLNIQQVLSTIKTKQPAVPGISPLLIRKVSRGIRPVTTLFEHINNQYAKSCRNLGSSLEINQEQGSVVELHQNVPSYGSDYVRRNTNNAASQMASQAQFKQNITCEPLYEEDEESRSSSSEPCKRNQMLQEKTVGYEGRLDADVGTDNSVGCRQQNQYSRQRHSRKQLVAAGVGDSLTGNDYNYSNNKEMAEVFQRLHDEFDKMITQHEKLKEQMEKRKDKSLVKEMSQMEAEMTAKEREINVFASLYKEVMALKQQMKLLHERNSFVCIATEETMYPAVLKKRAQTAGVFEMSSRSKDHRINGPHETSNALRLTGLLRQIQAFQRQLTLA